MREGDFHPKTLPYRRRASLELSEAILALYAAGVSTRSISRFLEGIYGAFYSPQLISQLTQVVKEEVRAWRERPWAERSSPSAKGKGAKEPVYMALGINPDGRRRSCAFVGLEGKSARDWEEVLKNLMAGVRILFTKGLPRLKEAL